MQKIPIRQIITAPRDQAAGRFSIRDVGQLLAGKDLVHGLHRHDFFFILSLDKGAGAHEIDFVDKEVKDGSVFILRPGQVHRLELSAGSTGFLVEFDPSFYHPKNEAAAGRWRRSAGRNHGELEAAGFVKLHGLLRDIFGEFARKESGYWEAIQSYLDLFFLEYTRQSRDLPGVNTPGGGYAQQRFEELLRLLEANIGSMKTVSQYADLLSLSSYQLNAITKGSVGRTVSSLIDEQIILEAKRHLLATSSQVKDIADELGYEDVSYFIRFFRKHTGHSPEAFRKNFK